MWKVVYSKQAQKDAKYIVQANLKNKVEEIILIIEKNPFEKYPPYEKLLGDLNGYYSRRINIKHRLVYQVYEKERIVKILRMWTHYE